MTLKNVKKWSKNNVGKSEITEVNDRITLHRFVETPYIEVNIASIAMNDGTS